MSLTPLDESEGEPREGGRPAGDRSDDRPGFLQRIRGAIGRVVAALSGATDSRETTVEATGTEGGERSLAGGGGGHAETRLDARTAERSLTWADEPAEDPPERGEPLDRPELVASWDDRGLTLSEPESGEAAISSDTWTDVER